MRSKHVTTSSAQLDGGGGGGGGGGGSEGHSGEPSAVPARGV